MLLGTLVHFVAFYLIFLNLPGDAPIAPVEGTNSSAYIRPRYGGQEEPVAGGLKWSTLMVLRVCELCKVMCQVLRELGGVEVESQRVQGSFAMVAFNPSPPGSSLGLCRSTEVSDQDSVPCFLSSKLLQC